MKIRVIRTEKLFGHTTVPKRQEENESWCAEKQNLYPMKNYWHTTLILEKLSKNVRQLMRSMVGEATLFL